MKQIRYRDLAALGIPYTRTHIMTLAARQSFPAPLKLMNGAVVWDRAEIQEWLAARKAAV